MNNLSILELKLILKTIKALKLKPQPFLLKNKIIANCFYEPSIRTRLSFEIASQLLGASIVSFYNNNSVFTNVKDESLVDTMSIISSYVDVIIMRHPKEGIINMISNFSKCVPILNAGDGSNEHPSQTILDIFSIYETQGKLNNLNVAMVGDLKYNRTVHSLVKALSKFGYNRFYFIPTSTLFIPLSILDILKNKNINYSIHNSIDEIINKLDILYMTRIQKERLTLLEYSNIKTNHILNTKMFFLARDNLRILHPLPRMNEIPYEIDNTPYAYYFQQARNGIYARQALLALMAGFNKVIF